MSEDVIERLERIERMLERQAETPRKIDLSDPLWSIKHIAKYLHVSPSYVSQKVLKTPGFPASRVVHVGPEGEQKLRPRYDKAAVERWHAAQPVDLKASA